MLGLDRYGLGLVGLGLDMLEKDWIDWERIG